MFDYTVLTLTWFYTDRNSAFRGNSIQIITSPYFSNILQAPSSDPTGLYTCTSADPGFVGGNVVHKVGEGLKYTLY